MKWTLLLHHFWWLTCRRMIVTRWKIFMKIYNIFNCYRKANLFLLCWRLLVWPAMFIHHSNNRYMGASDWSTTHFDQAIASSFWEWGNIVGQGCCIGVGLNLDGTMSELRSSRKNISSCNLILHRWELWRFSSQTIVVNLDPQCQKVRNLKF